MKYQIKRLATISIIMIAAATSTTYAGCEWTHGSLGQTIQSTSDRLKLYAVCKDDCKKLEAELNNTVTMMSTASECGGDVLTAKNKSMINFFTSRFSLIKKQKSGHNWTVAATKAPKPTQIESRDTKMAISQPAYQALWDEDNVPAVAAPRPIQINPPQTKMVISPEAYQALWLEKNKAEANQQTTSTAQFAQARKLREMQLARQRQVEQQRQIQIRKLAQIQQQNLRNHQARNRKIQRLQHQERVQRQQLQQQRERAAYLAQKRARQQQLARAQSN